MFPMLHSEFCKDFALVYQNTVSIVLGCPGLRGCHTSLAPLIQRMNRVGQSEHFKFESPQVFNQTTARVL